MLDPTKIGPFEKPKFVVKTINTQNRYTIMSTMKNIVRFSALVSVFALVGCESTQTKPAAKPAAPVAPVVSTPSNSPLAGAPSWVLNPTIEGGLSAVGSAPQTAAGLAFQRTRALANARDELARQISIEVNNMIKEFVQTTGIGTAETVDTVASSVSKQVSTATLAGSRQQNTWVGNDGTLYVLVVMKPETIAQATKDAYESAVKTSMGNDQALYQQFLSERAMGELDAEIEKRFSR